MQNIIEQPSAVKKFSRAEIAKYQINAKLKKNNEIKRVQRVWSTNATNITSLALKKSAPTTKKKSRAKTAKQLALSLGSNYDNLKIVNNFCLTDAYQRAHKVPLKTVDGYQLVNPQIAALDGISAAWLLWQKERPEKLPLTANIKEVRAFFRSACSYEAAHHYRDVSNNGRCYSETPTGKSKKARGLRAAFIRQTFIDHLQGKELDLAIRYFCDGQTASTITADLSLTRQAVTYQIKRLSQKISDINHPVNAALSSIIDDNLGQSFSLSLSRINDIIDRHDKRVNNNYIIIPDVIESVNNEIERRARSRALAINNSQSARARSRAFFQSRKRAATLTQQQKIDLDRYWSAAAKIDALERRAATNRAKQARLYRLSKRLSTKLAKQNKAA